MRWPKTSACVPSEWPGRRLVRPMKVATYSVAGFLELLEGVKAGLQVLDRTAGQLVGHDESVEGGTCLGGFAVQSDRSSELRVEQIVQ